MIAITDTNIFYSALAAPDGEIAKILSERKNIQFLVPDYLLEEIEEHLPDIAKITKKTQNMVVRQETYFRSDRKRLMDISLFLPMK